MNITIVGGGLHGWLTALIVKKFYPTDNITVIASDSIGILGVGEGTTPGFVQVCDFLGISVSDLVKHCNATIKVGVDFINWHGDGTSYFHGFASRDDLDFSALDEQPFIFNGLAHKQISENRSLDEVSLGKKLSDLHRVPFVPLDGSVDKTLNPIRDFEQLGSFALHIEASTSAPFFKERAVSQGVKFIEGKVTEFINDSDERICELVLEDGTRLATDFVFDCSGFARLVLGKHYKQEWVSYSEYLPLTHAIAFPTPHDGSQSVLKPATEAIAMPHGWMWRVPIQSRYGNGYVYDGSMITEEQAIAEIEEYHGIKLGYHMKFSYNPGSFRKTLHKNALAVGIAQSFVEPMEATSIWVGFINVIRCLRQGGMEIRDQAYQDQFNEVCYDTNWSIMEFLYLHYLGQRSDTEFWQTFRTRTNYAVAMQRLGRTLDLWKQATPIDNDFTDRTDLLNAINWMQLGQGLRLFDDEHRLAFKRRLERITGGAWGSVLDEPIARFQANQEHWVGKAWEHRSFLDYLKSR